MEERKGNWKGEGEGEKKGGEGALEVEYEKKQRPGNHRQRYYLPMTPKHERTESDISKEEFGDPQEHSDMDSKIHESWSREGVWRHSENFP